MWPARGYRVRGERMQQRCARWFRRGGPGLHTVEHPSRSLPVVDRRVEDGPQVGARTGFRGAERRKQRILWCADPLWQPTRRVVRCAIGASDAAASPGCPGSTTRYRRRPEQLLNTVSVPMRWFGGLGGEDNSMEYRPTLAASGDRATGVSSRSSTPRSRAHHPSPRNS